MSAELKLGWRVNGYKSLNGDVTSQPIENDWLARVKRVYNNGTWNWENLGCFSTAQEAMEAVDAAKDTK